MPYESRKKKAIRITGSLAGFGFTGTEAPAPAPAAAPAAAPAPPPNPAPGADGDNENNGDETTGVDINVEGGSDRRSDGSGGNADAGDGSGASTNRSTNNITSDNGTANNDGDGDKNNDSDGGGGDGDGDGDDDGGDDDDGDDSGSEGGGDDVDNEQWSDRTMKWFDSVKTEINENVKFSGRGRNAHFRGKMPREYRTLLSPSRDTEAFFDNDKLLTMDDFCLPDLQVWFPEAVHQRLYPTARPPCPWHGTPDCVTLKGWVKSPRHCYGGERVVALMGKKY